MLAGAVPLYTRIVREASGQVEKVRAHAENDLSSRLVIDAVCVRLSAGSESCNRRDGEVIEGFLRWCAL